MKDTHIVILIDGSVYYETKDPRGHIHGYGRYALHIYYGNKEDLQETIQVPASTRTHINIMEIKAILPALEWINDDINQIKIQKAENIIIVTDSQNVINIISHEHPPKDDVMIKMARQIGKEMQNIKDKKYKDELIKIYWTKSHAESKLNNKVDKAAKQAAQVVRDNPSIMDKQNMINPNNDK